MTEELEQLLKNLKLRRMLKVYDEQLRAAETADVSYSEFVAGLLQDRRRQNRTRLQPLVEGFAERLPLPVHSRAGSVRRNVRAAGPFPPLMM